MEPASLTTWLQPMQFTTQSIQSVWKCQVLFRILQTFKNLNLLFIGQMIKSQSEKCLAQNESNISVGVHVGSSLIKVKDTHLHVAEILCWRLSATLYNTTQGVPGELARWCSQSRPPSQEHKPVWLLWSRLCDCFRWRVGVWTSADARGFSTLQRPEVHNPDRRHVLGRETFWFRFVRFDLN